MSSIERIHAAVEDLRTRNVPKQTAAPLTYRLLWRLGIPLRPPLYQSFLGLVLVHGILFGVPLGAMLACADRRLAPDGATMIGALAGAISGLVIAAYYRLKARWLGLPTWDEYSFVVGTEEEEGW